MTNPDEVRRQVAKDLKVGFKKAVDEFMNKPGGVDYFHLEGDFNFPSIVRYQFGDFSFSTDGMTVANPVTIEETHAFSVSGLANIPHLRNVPINARFNENGAVAGSAKPTMVGTGILEERGFDFSICVPPAIAKNSFELMCSGQYRTTLTGDPEIPHIRIRFDLCNIKTDSKDRPIFDLQRVYIYDDGWYSAVPMYDLRHAPTK